MTSISNISNLPSRAAISASRINNAYNKLVNQAVTNTKPINVIDSIINGRTSSDVALGKLISKSIDAGLSITNVAKAKLESVQQQVKKLKSTVTGLEYADSVGLKIAAQDYSNQMKEIYGTLKFSNYCGVNLFDGTLAQAPAQRLSAQNLPNNAAALDFQANIDASSRTLVSISQMIAGDGRPNSVDPVIGTFNPLFKVTDNAKAALAALDKVAAYTGANAVSNTIVTGRNKDDGTPIYQWDKTDMRGSYGAQIALIRGALPKGVNSEQDLIADFAVSSFIICAGAYFTAEITASAVKSLRFAQATTKLISLSDINVKDVKKAYDHTLARVETIVGNPGGADAAGIAAGRAIIENIDDTISYAQSVLKNIALTSYDATDNGKKGSVKEVLFPPAYRLYNPEIITAINIGNVITSADRKQALEILDNMDNALSSEIANINSSQKALLQSQDVIKVQIPQLDDVANNISSTNYNNIIADILQNLRQGKTLGMMRVMEENAHDNRLESLEDLANS